MLNEKNITRRKFVKGAAVAALGVASSGMLIGCSPKETSVPVESKTSSLPEGKYSWEVAPEPIPTSKITETLEADIVIVGAGTAGITAALAAVEEGASVIVLQKGVSWMTHGWAIGAINSRYEIAGDYELSKPEVMDILNTFMRDSCNKPDMNLVKLWADNSGHVVNWLGDYSEPKGNGPAFVDFRRDKSKLYFGDSEYTHEYPLIHMWAPPTLHVGLMEIIVDIAKEKGVKFLYNSPAVRLLREGEDRVTGVISQTDNGSYLQVNASKAVIMCTGDYGNDKEMLEKYCPTVLGITNGYKPADNTGDGHKMAMWIGAALERTPHATMVHYKPTIMPEGDYPFDATPWLWVNKNGKRYMNEDTPFGWLYQQDVLQPGNTRYQICDSNYNEQWPHLGNSSFRTDGEKAFGSFEDGLESKGIQKADTIEELAVLIGAPADALTATVNRYNELCKNGFDEDYGKKADYLEHTTILTPPFYALRREPGVLTIPGGGLDINTDLQVLDTSGKVIDGLYAAGNVSGNFFGYDYPLTIPGVSLGRATTFGYLAAKNAVRA